jgi:hypothetical protein
MAPLAFAKWLTLRIALDSVASRTIFALNSAVLAECGTVPVDAKVLIWFAIELTLACSKLRST